MTQEVDEVVESGEISEMAGKLLYERLQMGYQNPNRLSGICQVNLEGPGEQSFYLTFKPEELEYTRGVHARPDAVVFVSTKVAHDLAVGDNINIRDPKNRSLFQMTGDVGLLSVLAQMTKIPNRSAGERFRAAEESAARGPKVTEVVRLERPTAEVLAEAIEAGQPVIATGALDHWALSWDFAYLKEHFGNVVIRSNLGSTTFGEYIERLDQPNPEKIPYTFGADLPKEMLEFFEPPFFAKESFAQAQLWMGCAPDTISTLLHRDSGDAFLGQIIGRKRLILFAPDETKFLYTYKSYNRDQPCWYNAWERDFETYPLARNATPLEFTLHPGELLVIPRGWFHTVKALDVTMSVGYHREPVSDFGRLLAVADDGDGLAGKAEGREHADPVAL
jgi:hypothetical protein